MPFYWDKIGSKFVPAKWADLGVDEKLGTSVDVRLYWWYNWC